MYVVQKLETHYPQASKTSIGHVVQLLYRSVIFIIMIIVMMIVMMIVSIMLVSHGIIVKLRSRSRSGEGQVRVMKVKEPKDLDLRYTLFLVFTTHPPTHPPHKLFCGF